MSIEGDPLPEPPEGDVETGVAKRMLSLDFIRGVAIFLMVILHAFTRMMDTSWAQDIDTLLQKNVFVILGAGLLAYLGTVAGLFLIISITVNIFSAHKKLEKGFTPEQILGKQVAVGFLVLFCAYLTESILHHAGILGSLIFQRPNGVQIMLQRIFHFETLHAIGWCLVLNSVLHYLLVLRPLSKGRDTYLRALIIYGVIALVIFIATPFLYQFIANNYDNFPGEEYSGKQWEWPPAGVGDFFLRLFLVFLAGNLEPMFPFFASGIIGAVIGMCLARKKPPRFLPLFIFIGALCALLAGVLIIVIKGDFEYTYFRPTSALYFLSLFGQLGFIALSLWLIEFRGYTKYFTPISRYWRRWGFISLSIYMLEIVDAAPRYLMQLITGWPVAAGSASAWQTLITTIVLVLFWEGIIRLWELVGFIGSFEWMIAFLTSLGKGMPASARLNVRRIIYDVEPITFKGMWSEPIKTTVGG
ncbi:MAG: hypothetical protein ACFFDI_25835 [Promethearchaeota archaeon]